MDKFVSLKGLELYTKLMKQYIDKKIELAAIGKTNCPNCGSPITSEVCEYCGTDFGSIMKLIK